MSESAIQKLRTRLRGPLLRPGDRDYEKARSIWNGMTARRPSLIARVVGDVDVIACVNFARELGLPLSIRGGGHNVAGTALCDGGLTIDMSLRREVRVEPDRALARAGAGATWGEVDRETQPFGLAVPSGIVSNTGVAGLTMGGGFGWISRKFGFTADNLLSFDIVTADGRLRHVSATDNPELFWAVRGGGGNFGVVTSFQFAAHRLGPDVLCGVIVYPLEQVRAVAHRFREVCANAPDELSCLLILRHAPAVPFLRPELHGRPIVAIAACWAGDAAAGARAMRPLRTVGDPLADTIELKSFIAHQTMLDTGQPFGRRYYWKSHFCADIDGGLVDTLLDHCECLPSPYSAVLLMHLGGAPARLDPAVNAVGLRDAAYVLNIQAAWEHPQDDEQNRSWALDCWTSVTPFSTGRVYVNFMTEDEGEPRLRAAFGEGVYARLREIKTRWDPSNMFHGAQNILPDTLPR
jgi:FAD binding domain/Berberine and berberine like